MRAMILAALIAALPLAGNALTLERLGEMIAGLDPEAQSNGAFWQLTVEDVPVIVVADATHDRMRAMVPIRSAEGLTTEDLQRAMQANFDAVLDARYAIAQGRLWSAFIHPLEALEEREFLSGLGQVVVAAMTYGSSYTSGALTFGGGDSVELHRQLIERLLEKGERI